MTSTIDGELVDHLKRADGQEDITFALYQPSTGATRSTALLVEVVLPEGDERAVHGNASFSSAYFLRAAGLAAEKDLGLALLHSHPRAKGWQGLSRDDRAAESGHASQAEAITGLPLVGMTLATGDGSYSARRWQRRTSQSNERRVVTWYDEQAVTVRVIGARIRASFNDALLPVPQATRRTLRTVQAWGSRTHGDLIRLRIGVIGAGSVAQLVAEGLERTGFLHVDVLDFDMVEEHNLDRLLHAGINDVGDSKVRTLTGRLAASAATPGAVVHGFEDSVVEPDGWTRALDCDVLFSCVDRPWPRYALNVAAYAHFIPVIDGGVAVDVRSRTPQPQPGEVPQQQAQPGQPDELSTDVNLLGAEWRAHLVGPGHKCLECLGQYDPSDVTAERAGLLDDPTYIAALPRDHRLRRGENVFTFSMACAAAEVLELLRAVLSPSGIADVGATLTHWATATTDRDSTDCAPRCPYSHDLLGKGDAAGVDVTGPHAAAERSRALAHGGNSDRAASPGPSNAGPSRPWWRRRATPGDAPCHDAEWAD